MPNLPLSEFFPDICFWEVFGGYSGVCLEAFGKHLGGNEKSGNLINRVLETCMTYDCLRGFGHCLELLDMLNSLEIQGITRYMQVWKIINNIKIENRSNSSNHGILDIWICWNSWHCSKYLQEMNKQISTVY